MAFCVGVPMSSGSLFTSGKSARSWALCTVAIVALVLGAGLAASPVAFAQGQTAAPAAAEASQPIQADATAAIRNGFARIVLQFSDQVVSEVKSTGNVIVVTFKQPVDFTVDRIGRDLASIVSAVRRDPDGKGFRMALTTKVTINTMEAGEKLFIDILPENWKGPPPPLPQDVVEELTRRAREAERKARLYDKERAAKLLPPVTVRIGNHPTFTRLVFGLPEQVGVAIDRGAERLTIRIAKPFPTDLRPVKSALPQHIGSIEADQQGDELVYKLTIAQNADVRGFREDMTYIVDISAKDARPNAPDVLAGKREDNLPRDARQVTHLPSDDASMPAALPAVPKAAAPAAVAPAPPSRTQEVATAPAVPAPQLGRPVAPPVAAPAALLHRLQHQRLLRLSRCKNPSGSRSKLR